MDGAHVQSLAHRFGDVGGRIGELAIDFERETKRRRVY